MRLPDPRELDRRLVPLAARRLRRAVDALDGVRAGAAGRVGAVLTSTRAALAAWARRADDRWAAAGPLALVREVPQLALLLVASVLVSGAFAAVWLAEPEPAARPGPQPASTLLARAALGVPPGAEVEQHLAASGRLLEELAGRRPEASYVALVSLADYLPVAELPARLPGVQPQRVYLRAPGVDGAEVLEVPVAAAGTGSVLPALCSATGSRKRSEAESLRSLAGTIEPVTAEDELQRDAFLADADRVEAEAAAYDGGCRTAFAVVVEGPAAALRGLLGVDGVRGVEVAPAGLSAVDLTVTPLPPESTGRLPSGAQG